MNRRFHRREPEIAENAENNRLLCDLCVLGGSAVGYSLFGCGSSALGL